MAVHAIDIVNLSEMKQQLDLGAIPGDTTFDATVTNNIIGAVETIDPMIRIPLLDKTISKTIPLPSPAEPIYIQEYQINQRSATPDTPVLVTYWQPDEIHEQRPTHPPTGVAAYAWADVQPRQTTLWPAAAGWPQSDYPYYRIDYDIGTPASQVPDAIRQAIILLARRLYHRYETMGRNSTWYQLLGPYRNKTV